MKFEQIKPFVRYAAQLKSKSNDANNEFVKSYDNCIIYILSGSGTVCVGENHYNMSKGSILFWRANTKYKLFESGENVSYIMINFDFADDNKIINSFRITPEAVNIFDESRVSDVSYIEDREEFNNTIYQKSMTNTEDMFLGICAEFKKPQRYLNMRVSARLIIILSELLDEYLFSQSIKHSDKTNDIINYIHEHYTQDLSNNDIAKYFGFHPQHINKLIKRKTGYSLHKYIIMRRIAKATELLETTKMPISEISNSIGFQNTCHFSRYFKEFIGDSPRKYRQKNKML